MNWVGVGPSGFGTKGLGPGLDNILTIDHSCPEIRTQFSELNCSRGLSTGFSCLFAKIKKR